MTAFMSPQEFYTVIHSASGSVSPTLIALPMLSAPANCRTARNNLAEIYDLSDKHELAKAERNKVKSLDQDFAPTK